MRLAVLSESSADEAAIRIIIDAILGEATEPVPSLDLRSRGWPSVERILPVVIKHLHYNTDAEAFAVVVDSDDSTIHQPDHEESALYLECRLCRLRSIAASVLAGLTPVVNRLPLKCGIGLAVPAIEAWFLCGVDPQINEAAWVRHLQSQPLTYTRRSLKLAVYGTDRPNIETATRSAIDSANRLSDNLELLTQLFPNGFGSLARDIGNW